MESAFGVEVVSKDVIQSLYQAAETPDVKPFLSPDQKYPKPPGTKPMKKANVKRRVVAPKPEKVAKIHHTALLENRANRDRLGGTKINLSGFSGVKTTESVAKAEGKRKRHLTVVASNTDKQVRAHEAVRNFMPFGEIKRTPIQFQMPEIPGLAVKHVKPGFSRGSKAALAGAAGLAVGGPVGAAYYQKHKQKKYQQKKIAKSLPTALRGRPLKAVGVGAPEKNLYIATRRYAHQSGKKLGPKSRNLSRAHLKNLEERIAWKGRKPLP